MKTRTSKQNVRTFKYSKDYVGGGEEYLTFNGTRTNLGNAMEAKVNKCSIGYRALPRKNIGFYDKFASSQTKINKFGSQKS
jgi:hypothetical protein